MCIRIRISILTIQMQSKLRKLNMDSLRRYKEYKISSIFVQW